MTDTTPSTSTPAEPSSAKGKSLPARVVGVFFSPRATYADVAARPRWLGALLVGSLVVIIGLFALFSTEVGQQAWLDQQVKGAESFGRTINDQQYEGMERIAPYIRYIVAAGYTVFVPIVLVIVSAMLLGIFNAFLGGDATFKQVFAVVVHSGLISALQTAFALPLDYVRETLSSPTTLAVFLPFIEETTFLGRLLGSIDLFQIWGTLSLAIGLGVLYKRRTAPIAWTLFIVYFVIVVAFAAIRSALS
jgi:hypothetical protein